MEGQRRMVTAVSPSHHPLEIKPKKLVNPVKEDKLRLDLHRELLFSQRGDHSPLNKKTELQRAIEKVKSKKEELLISETPPNEFQRVLKERKKLIEDNHYYVDDEEEEEGGGRGRGGTTKAIKEEEQEFFKVFKKIQK